MKKKKAQVFAAQISTNKVSWNDALYTYNASFMKTLEYIMADMQLTEEQWNATVRPALRATLNAAGMVKTFPHKVLYGPDLYQGLAIHRPYFLKEIMHIMTHIQESVCKSQPGGLLRLIAKALRGGLGVPFTLGSFYVAIPLRLLHTRLFV